MEKNQKAKTRKRKPKSGRPPPPPRTPTASPEQPFIIPKIPEKLMFSEEMVPSTHKHWMDHVHKAKRRQRCWLHCQKKGEKELKRWEEEYGRNLTKRRNDALLHKRRESKFKRREREYQRKLIKHRYDALHALLNKIRETKNIKY
ncbi:uncharacterized protein LOC110859714 [Folsomia candida]|uniref:Uncharacterized protein n=1 Tax=Folsomia candida TaxID=158441 RepID=A0A226DBF4_FOLCA|nr:uncharacterized protein LOC110859714 [Folsomia candida]OXA42174.1 hypothetical protein Fcan01_23273 [Folsomia candida]